MFHSVFCLGTSVFPGLEQGLAGPLLAFVIKFCWNTVMLFCYIAFMATFMLQRQSCISATETKWPVKAKIFTFITNSLPDAGLQEWQLFNKLISPSSWGHS